MSVRSLWPAASVANSSRAASESGWTASNDASARKVTSAISVLSRSPAACAEIAQASTPAMVTPTTSSASPSPTPPANASRRARRTSSSSAARTRSTASRLAAIDRELGRRAEGLDELGRQLAASSGLATTAAARQRPRHAREQRFRRRGGLRRGRVRPMERWLPWRRSLLRPQRLRRPTGRRRAGGGSGAHRRRPPSATGDRPCGTPRAGRVRGARCAR